MLLMCLLGKLMAQMMLLLWMIWSIRGQFVRWLSGWAKVQRRRRIWRVQGTDVEWGDEVLNR